MRSKKEGRESRRRGDSENRWKWGETIKKEEEEEEKVITGEQ